MNHFTTPKFWHSYYNLSVELQKTADKNFELLKADQHHPSLHFKKIGRFWSVRVGIHVRALGVDSPQNDGVIWFWIGSHAEYDQLISLR